MMNASSQTEAGAGMGRRILGHRAPAVVFGLALILWSGMASGYNQYSEGGDENCRACHGDFRADNHESLTGDGNWNASLMDVHAADMLSNDCATCHISGPHYPVNLNLSQGGAGLPAISCVGCHGRAEDRGINPDDCVGDQLPAPPGCVADPTKCPAPEAGEVCGDGAGLRQHHYRANQTINTAGGPVSTRICADCHSDAVPANFTPVDEDVLPPYYSASDPFHPSIPSDPCNPSPGFPEDYAASTQGLDNDGDTIYDDTDCLPEPDGSVLLAAGALFLVTIGQRRRR